ncbi:MAG: phosphomannomutase/phosphoglucomutase, partial [Chloroflexota bacterium]
LGTLPTPAFYYGKRRLGAPGGVMVTASHNPPRYNGFKLMLGELPITPEALQDLAGLMASRDWAAGEGRLTHEDVLPAYGAALTAAYAGLAPHRMVVDAGNGSMGPVAPAILRALGQDVVELYCETDGSFPHRDPNPAVASHLTTLCARVCEVGAELGVAYDGDGDRVVFVDDLGLVQPADRVLVLLARQGLRAQPGAAVVYDLKSSSVVAEEVQRAGGRALMERSGHAFIKARLLADEALLAGELSGHYFFREIGGDDALYATLALLRALEALGLPLRQAMATVPAYPITPDLRAPCPRDEAERIIAELAAAYADCPQSDLDGVRIAFPDGWALARPSVTEPLITLRFEARTPERLAAIQADVRRAVPRLNAVLRAAGL